MAGKAEGRRGCGQADWQAQPCFAEDVVTKFVIDHPEYASLFAYPTTEVEFPISNGYLQTLFDEIEEGDLEGKRFEYLACYLFMHIPGCTPAHNLLDEDKAGQTDVVIRNLTPQSNLIAETFGRHFIIECKSWDKSVGSPECGYFLHRIHLMHFIFGVMFTKEGITGDPKPNFKNNTVSDETAARQLIRRSFHEDGVTCIVLSYTDLKQLLGEVTFRAMLFQKIEEFRFGRASLKGNKLQDVL